MNGAAWELKWTLPQPLATAIHTEVQVAIQSLGLFCAN